MYIKPMYTKLNKSCLKDTIAEATCIIGYISCPGPYCGKGYSA